MVITMWIICLSVLLSGFLFEKSDCQTTSVLSKSVGDTIELSCPLSGTFTYPIWRGPPSSVKYTNQDDSSETINNAALAFGRLAYDADQKTLVLSSAETSDSGTYSCSYGGLGDHTITLTVTIKSTTTPPTSTTTPPSSSTTTPPPALSTAPPSTTTKSPDKKITVIIIVASVVGGVAIVVLSIIACIKLRKKTNRKKKYGAGPKTKDSKEMSSF